MTQRVPNRVPARPFRSVLCALVAAGLTVIGCAQTTMDGDLELRDDDLELDDGLDDEAPLDALADESEVPGLESDAILAGPQSPTRPEWLPEEVRFVVAETEPDAATPTPPDDFSGAQVETMSYCSGMTWMSYEIPVTECGEYCGVMKRKYSRLSGFAVEYPCNGDFNSEYCCYRWWETPSYEDRCDFC